MLRNTHILDAADQSLGRLASHIAIVLQGKHKPDFIPYQDKGDVVVVKHVRNLRFTGKKMKQKRYYSHSGYIGGLKEKSLAELFAKRPEEVVRKAVLRMLPKNRLRARRIKRLKFETP